MTDYVQPLLVLLGLVTGVALSGCSISTMRRSGSVRRVWTGAGERTLEGSEPAP